MIFEKVRAILAEQLELDENTIEMGSLIVDDLGAERPTSFSSEQICRAVDERAEAGKPLIVTTNYTLDEMRRCQDHEKQRIFDRLNALCVPVAVVGESRRVALGAEKLRAAKALLGA